MYKLNCGWSFVSRSDKGRSGDGVVSGRRRMGGLTHHHVVMLVLTIVRFW